MPIRVVCPKCGDVTHFADNDAGLTVACLVCRNRLKVAATPVQPVATRPATAARAATAAPASSPAPAQTTAAARAVASPTAAPNPAATAPVHAAPATTTAAAHRPAHAAPAGKGRWRAYSFMAVLVVAALLVIWQVNDRSKPSTVIANSENRPAAPSTPGAAPKPATRPVTLALAPAATPAPSDPKPAGAPIAPAPPPAPAPVLVSTYTPPAAPVGIVGVDRIELAGQVLIDSYNGSGAYDPATASDRALVLTNGVIQFAGQGQIRGVVHVGEPATTARPAPKPVAPAGAPAAPAPAPAAAGPATLLYAPPVMLDPFNHDSMNDLVPPDFLKGGTLALPAKTTLDLAAGVYYLGDLSVDATATLRVTGPVTLLVSGRVNLAGAVETADKRPANLRVRVTGEQPVTITGTTPLYLDLYAPGSPVDIAGKGDVHGSIVGRTLKVAGDRPLHFDESLTPPPAAPEAH